MFRLLGIVYFISMRNCIVTDFFTWYCLVFYPNKQRHIYKVSITQIPVQLISEFHIIPLKPVAHCAND